MLVTSGVVLRHRLLGLAGPLWPVVTEPFLPNSGLAWHGREVANPAVGI